MDRRDGPEKKLCAGGIRAWQVRVVHLASFVRVQLREGGIGGNRSVRIVAEPLHPPVPHVSKDIVLWTRPHQKKWNPPHRSHRQADEDDVASVFRRPNELTDGEKVGNAGHAQRDAGRAASRQDLGFGRRPAGLRS